METYLNQAGALGRTTICVGMGNEGSSRGHTSLRLTSRTEQDIELSVGNLQSSFNVQVWKNYVDEAAISIISPGGQIAGPLRIFQEPQRYRLENTQLLVYYGMPSPYSTAQEIYIDFLSENQYVNPGIWTIRFQAGHIVDGEIDLWLPGGGVLNEDTHFYFSQPDRTLTIPAAASGVISVGAYDSHLQSYAAFSGRGYTRVTNQIKPDLAAPGVRIQTTRAGGGYGEYTGTSFATPFVTGSAALMMEWGILKGNSPYLYGEAVKANLRRGARQLPGINQWPNPQLGYGEDVIIRLH